MDYKKAMQIDDTALDIEWLEQAELATKWGIKWADAKDELDRAEENVKVVRSELLLKISKDPEKYLGVDVKLTDPKIEAAYRTHPLHKQAKERWLTAQHNVNILEVVKNEISFTRKASLENMVQLFLGQYFAGPKIPRDLKSEIDLKRAKRKQINERVKINRKI